MEPVTYVSQRHERVSSESAYLTPAVLNRSNLTVVIRATVTRVLIDTTDDKPRAVGVEFVGHDNGPRYQARAKKEVVTWCGHPPCFKPFRFIHTYQRWRCSVTHRRSFLLLGCDKT